MARKWLILAAVSLILCVAVMIGVRAQSVKASSPSPLQLSSIGVTGSDYSVHASYHRGDHIDLWADYYDVTDQAIVFTAHPAVYHSSYRLLNVAVPYTSWAYIGMQEANWWVTIPKNAPLGTYKYWFTLSESGYPDQTLVVSFKVVK
jgi:hypothetical protein